MNILGLISQLIGIKTLRLTRTIVEMVRSMLKDKEMPNDFWAKAVNTAVYILNRCPT